MLYNINRPTIVNTQMIQDIIDTAGYSIGYWADEATVGENVYTVHDSEQDLTLTITHADIVEALTKIANHNVELNLHYSYCTQVNQWLDNTPEGDIDGELADYIIQIAGFGEVVYS